MSVASMNQAASTTAYKNYVQQYGTSLIGGTGYGVNPSTGQTQQYINKQVSAGGTTTGTNMPANYAKVWIGDAIAQNGGASAGAPAGPVDRVTSAAVADAERIRMARERAYAVGSGASAALGAA